MIMDVKMHISLHHCLGVKLLSCFIIVFVGGNRKFTLQGAIPSSSLLSSLHYSCCQWYLWCTYN